LKGKNIEIIVCKNCHKEFQWDGFRSRPRIYCCVKCKNRYCQKKYQSRMKKAYKIAKEIIQ